MYFILGLGLGGTSRAEQACFLIALVNLGRRILLNTCWGLHRGLEVFLRLDNFELLKRVGKQIEECVENDSLGTL